ncbi:beta-lactamase [Necator americanus]|uniref:Beta-lactamase n=1 Tax=Necator americanus TaxID=51031 RepID=W2SK85_NECAM|nr:beta-lactamase [Necator americanus]ETN69968.1 beta-lactamase [Necator americanus]
MDMLHTKHPLHFGGDADSEYESVRQAFQQNFVDGWEDEGASVAVYVRGRKVVDLWGGYADKQAARTWKKDTISVVFSSTKAVAALCIALLADRGRLRYDDLVSKHWPGFAKNGKDNITIEWVMSHMTGLHYFDTPITEEMAYSHDIMRKVIESETPKTVPGGQSGYQALTYGWLVDQIVRHTDEKKRGIGQFLREEITQPHDIDFHIGLNPSEEHRVARVSLSPISGLIGEMWHDFRVAEQVYNFWTMDKNSPLMKIIANPSWFNVMTQCTVNNPDHHAMVQAAALGIGNARSLASIFNLFINGRIVSEKTMSLLKRPVNNETDLVILLRVAKGHGFFYGPVLEEDNILIGHSGHGCQQVIFDLKNKVVIAYVTNGMKTGFFDRCRTYARIHKAVYDVVMRSQSAS